MTVCVALVVPTFWFPNVRPAGVTVTAVPMPVKATICGLLGALSVTEREAVRVPTSVGWNVTLYVQVPPAGRLEPHVVVFEKSAALAPVMVAVPMVMFPEPVLVTVTVAAVLEVFTGRMP